jgi:predicted dehydrogenase
VNEPEWVGVVGPFPATLRPTTRWRDRYGLSVRPLAEQAIESALADPKSRGLMLHWRLQRRIEITQRALGAGKAVCLPGPLLPAQQAVLEGQYPHLLIGMPSHALPAVRAMRLAIGAQTTGPVRYVSVRRTSPPEPGTPQRAPLTDTLVAACTLLGQEPEWVFAYSSVRAGASTVAVNLHCANAEALCTWVQVPDGDPQEEWLLYGTCGMLQQRDTHSAETLATHLLDHWLAVQAGREEPLLCPQQSLQAARFSAAIELSLHKHQRVVWKEVAL